MTDINKLEELMNEYHIRMGGVEVLLWGEVISKQLPDFIAKYRRMEDALKPALNVMEMIIEPETIKKTSTVHAYAMCVRVAASLRKVLQD